MAKKKKELTDCDLAFIEQMEFRRKALGLLHNQVVRRLEGRVWESDYSKWKSGKKPVPDLHICAIAKVLDIDDSFVENLLKERSAIRSSSIEGMSVQETPVKPLVREIQDRDVADADFSFQNLIPFENREMNATIGGKWLAIFLCPDISGKLMIVEEHLVFFIEANGVISEQLEVNMEGYPGMQWSGHGYHVLFEKVLFGFSIIRTWNFPYGSGVSQLLLSKSDDWLEGYITYVNVDTNLIEGTQYIAVRESSRDFKYLQELARQKIGKSLDAMTMLRSHLY